MFAIQSADKCNLLPLGLAVTACQAGRKFELPRERSKLFLVVPNPFKSLKGAFEPENMFLLLTGHMSAQARKPLLAFLKDIADFIDLGVNGPFRHNRSSNYRSR